MKHARADLKTKQRSSERLKGQVDRVQAEIRVIMEVSLGVSLFAVSRPGCCIVGESGWLLVKPQHSCCVAVADGCWWQ